MSSNGVNGVQNGENIREEDIVIVSMRSSQLSPSVRANNLR